MSTAFKNVVYAGNFYRCPTQRMIASKIHDDNRYSVLFEVLKEIGNHLINGTIDALYHKIITSYKDDWFTISSLREQIQADDISSIRRFVAYVGNETIISPYREISVETPAFIVHSSVNLITEDTGQYTAYIIRAKKADKSPGGRGIHTNSETDLACMVAKAALEKEFPAIRIRLVYLFNDDDSLGNVGKFNVLKTKKSNVFTSDYLSFYDECRSFSYEAFFAKIEEVLTTKVEPNCFECDSKDICQKNTIKTSNMAKAKDEYAKPKSYSMPSFTASQLEVINKVDGAMLVCAGPGSGKTATVVGRIKHLINMGIPAEFILAITFTRDAAHELMERCLSFCERDELPEILTLNALGYKILKLNPEYVGKVSLMTQRERFTLIGSLLDISKPLEGFNYNLIKGNNGLISKVDKALTKLSKEGSEGFKSDFLKFAETYNEAVRARGYISFDEQISLSQKLFDEHPDVLKNISNRYKYIMVDEFQDIDDAQAKFIYSLSKNYKNICCVGDDDQSIYAFRGGTPKYMLHFRQLYPDASIFLLKENFRSTEKIISAANKQIEQNDRLQKTVTPVKKGGISPEHISSQESEALEKVVEQLHMQGIAYEDIAVIASKNATLEKFEHDCAFPSVLGKEYLVDSAFFKVLHLALKRMLSTVDNAKSEVYLEEIIGDRALYEKVVALTIDGNAVAFVESVAKILGLQDTAVLSAVLSVISSNHVNDCRTLYEVMQYMADYGDEQRVEPDTQGKVIFITAHESKGMEWKAVLMLDDYKEEKSEEQNRLIYVAMTRAKERLFIFHNQKRSSVAA